MFQVLRFILPQLLSTSTCTRMADDRSPPGDTSNGFDDEEEFLAMGRIAHALLHYAEDAGPEIMRARWNYTQLPERHQKLLAHLPAKHDAVVKLVQINQTFLKHVVQANQDMQAVGRALDAAKAYSSKESRVSPMDASKVRYTLKNLVRDWSIEGEAERAQSYGWILDAAARHGPPSDGAHVLVPGAGLLRLPFEFACRGYRAAGNEFSYFMLLMSSFITNMSPSADCWTIHPYALSTCNQFSDDAQLRAVTLPDRAPGVCARDWMGEMSVIAGDFVPTFRGDTEYAAAFDIVATAFFVDTAHNILEFIEVISYCLKDGGLWINAGPLLYHWADSNDPQHPDLSLEISLDDVKLAALALGFRLIEEDSSPMTYMGDTQGMYSTSYTGARWVMQKHAPP